MKRIYVDLNTLTIGCLVKLPPVVTHRLINVLRYRLGQSIILFNGDGYDYSGNIKVLNKQQAIVEIEQQIEKQNEATVHSVLLQGVCKFDRMDWAIQKAVEIGVGEIVPVLCEYSQIKQDKKRFAKKMLHWQSIVISACEQSGRSKIPKLYPISRFDEVIDMAKNNYQKAQKLVLHPYQSRTFSSLPYQTAEVLVAIGPEGGFSETEINFFQQQEFDIIKLGNTILRAETAALVALSLIHLAKENSLHVEQR